MVSDMDAPQAVVVDQVDGVLTVTLNRPAKLNALNDEIVEGLCRAFDTIDPEVRAVVLKGAGRAFSSGHDLTEDLERETGFHTARRSAEDLQQLTRLMRRCPAPIVGRIQGYAIGAGAEIALSCDLVVAAEDAVFQFPEVSVGLIVTNGFTSALPRTLGRSLAKEIFILGERFTGADAYRWGLVNRVVAPDQLDGAVADIIARIRRQAPIAVTFAKRLVDQGFESDPEAALAREVQAAIIADRTDDASEAKRAFAESRQPKFVGR